MEKNVSLISIQLDFINHNITTAAGNWIITVANTKVDFSNPVQHDAPVCEFAEVNRV